MLLIGRSAILLLSFQWLTTTEFALIASAFSFAEILRTLTDVGAENIIYSRLSSTNKPIPNIVKSLVKFRVLVSFLVSAIFSFASYYILAQKYGHYFFCQRLVRCRAQVLALCKSNVILEKYSSWLSLCFQWHYFLYVLFFHTKLKAFI